MKKPTINILTRTSSRPIGFHNCHASIINQTYKKVKHIVSYENIEDEKYLQSNRIEAIKVEKAVINKPKNKFGYIHAPYNLYCNALLSNVQEGWIMFLDDDDNLLHNKVLEELVKVIETIDDDTLLVWKMRYPDGRTLPPKQNVKSKAIEINKIGSCCFMFHSKYKNKVRWDEYKGSDFRFLNELTIYIPKQKWIDRVYVQINNFGDFGKQNDLDSITNSLIYNKNYWWYFLPKYHTVFLGFKVFNIAFYKKILKKI